MTVLLGDLRVGAATVVLAVQDLVVGARLHPAVTDRPLATMALLDRRRPDVQLSLRAPALLHRDPSRDRLRPRLARRPAN